MNEITGRLSDVIVSLNQQIQKVQDNDTVEFDLENRLNVLETAVDDLTTDIDDTLEFAEETST